MSWLHGLNHRCEAVLSVATHDKDDKIRMFYATCSRERDHSGRHEQITPDGIATWSSDGRTTLAQLPIATPFATAHK